MPEAKMPARGAIHGTESATTENHHSAIQRYLSGVASLAREGAETNNPHVVQTVLRVLQMQPPIAAEAVFDPWAARREIIRRIPEALVRCDWRPVLRVLAGAGWGDQARCNLVLDAIIDGQENAFHAQR